MHLVPKPEGFELRDKRSDKSGRGADWTAADCLYDSQQEMNTAPPEAVLVLWYTKSQDGALIYRSRYAGADFTLKLRLAIDAVGYIMGWSR